MTLGSTLITPPELDQARVLVAEYNRTGNLSAFQEVIDSMRMIPNSETGLGINISTVLLPGHNGIAINVHPQAIFCDFRFLARDVQYAIRNTRFQFTANPTADFQFLRKFLVPIAFKY